MFLTPEFTFCTAFNTHFHKNLPLSPSLNSNASCIHVEAPEGHIPVHIIQLSSVKSTSTVGFHLESIISLACIAFILYIFYFVKIYYINNNYLTQKAIIILNSFLSFLLEY